MPNKEVLLHAEEAKILFERQAFSFWSWQLFLVHFLGCGVVDRVVIDDQEGGVVLKIKKKSVILPKS